MSGVASVASFVCEMRRRKVWHVLVAYVSVGIAVALAFAELYDDAGLPEWTTKFVLVLLVLGLPVALVLAWAYELRPENGKGVPAVGEENRGGPVGKSERAADPVPDVPAEPPDRSIVVLPFENLSPDPDQEYFCDGMTEEIITDLSRLRSLHVISRTSAMLLKGSGKDVKTIGREVGVRYVLEGSVRKARERLRVTAQLIDSRTDAHLWAERYDGEVGDVFAIQENVARAIADALRMELSPEEDRSLASVALPEFEAYDWYIRSRYEVYRFTPESIESGIRSLERGLELFPDSPLLLAALGEAYFVQYDWVMVREERVVDRAEELARRALSIDPRSAQGKKLLGHVERYRGTATRACGYFLEAYRADPNDTGIMLHTANLLSQVGRGELAAPIYRRLIAADPLTPFNYLAAAVCDVMRGERESAVDFAREFRSREPTVSAPTSAYLALVFFLGGRRAEAVCEIDRALTAGVDPTHDWLLRLTRSASTGEAETALELLTPDARAFAWDDADLPLFLPAFFADLGLVEETVAWTGRALQRGLVNYPFFAEVGPFGKVRGDERFQTLLTALHQEWEGFDAAANSA